ncbi:uncharacterized protein [Dermacentor albipictus]|uniref:uncharacterized protein isoform X2 n=1 Tax=Dermacentor albipictus TaxID=60249 RepID=UPI0038FC15C4
MIPVKVLEFFSLWSLGVVLGKLGPPGGPQKLHHDVADTLKAFTSFPFAVAISDSDNDTIFECMYTTQTDVNLNAKTATYAWYFPGFGRAIPFYVRAGEEPGTLTFTVEDDPTLFEGVIYYTDYENCVIADLEYLGHHDDYSFAKPLSLRTPFLFTINERSNFSDTMGSIMSPGFSIAAQQLYKTMNARGFGIIQKAYFQLRTNNTLRSIVNIFKTLKEVLKSVQYRDDETATFFMFPYKYEPVDVTLNITIRELNEHVKIIGILLLFDQRHPTNNRLSCISSAVSNCMESGNQASLLDVVSTIPYRKKPTAILVLSLSMSIYQFGCAIQVSSNAPISCGTIKRFPFEQLCSSVMNNGSEYKQSKCDCHMQKIMSHYYIYETPKYLKEKIAKIYEMLQQKNLNISLGWVLDVTHNIAPTECGGDFFRIKAARQAIGES